MPMLEIAVLCSGVSAVLRRKWKRRLVEDLGFHIAHELLGMHLTKAE